ncbi:conserved hypothetical protein [Histoplasma capsulatum H143]|uniref:C2H2-type domain-containing protein n=1 Tax=Ajellomyces capsulatus (strain H143) TaxID=544712 RepID=C6HQU1_AJECH|nr:conserved hypothetical protein [Histoplasma capsulatum H143]
MVSAHNVRQSSQTRICTRTFVDKTALLNHERTSAKHAKPQVLR